MMVRTNTNQYTTNTETLRKRERRRIGEMGLICVTRKSMGGRNDPKLQSQLELILRLLDNDEWSLEEVNGDSTGDVYFEVGETRSHSRLSLKLLPTHISKSTHTTAPFSPPSLQKKHTASITHHHYLPPSNNSGHLEDSITIKNMIAVCYYTQSVKYVNRARLNEGMLGIANQENKESEKSPYKKVLDDTMSHVSKHPFIAIDVVHENSFYSAMFAWNYVELLVHEHMTTCGYGPAAPQIEYGGYGQYKGKWVDRSRGENEVGREVSFTAVVRNLLEIEYQLEKLFGHVRSGHSRLGFLGKYVLELAMYEFFMQSDKDGFVFGRELMFLLLSSYGATVGEKDTGIYKIMQDLERLEKSTKNHVADMDYMWGTAAIRVRKEREIEHVLSSDDTDDNEKHRKVTLETTFQ
ncbi:hypothetical protein Tco_0668227 [Tanacetum coccineum]